MTVAVLMANTRYSFHRYYSRRVSKLHWHMYRQGDVFTFSSYSHGRRVASALGATKALSSGRRRDGSIRMLQPHSKHPALIKSWLSQTIGSVLGKRNGPSRVRVRHTAYQRELTNAPRNADDLTAEVNAEIKDLKLGFFNLTSRFRPRYIEKAAFQAFQNRNAAFNSQLLVHPPWTIYKQCISSLLHAHIYKDQHTWQGIGTVCSGSPRTSGRLSSLQYSPSSGAWPVFLP